MSSYALDEYSPIDKYIEDILDGGIPTSVLVREFVYSEKYFKEEYGAGTIEKLFLYPKSFPKELVGIFGSIEYALAVKRDFSILTRVKLISKVDSELTSIDVSKYPILSNYTMKRLFLDLSLILDVRKALFIIKVMRYIISEMSYNVYRRTDD